MVGVKLKSEGADTNGAVSTQSIVVVVLLLCALETSTDQIESIFAPAAWHQRPNMQARDRLLGAFFALR